MFNILGPLTNPAGAKRQVMGVFDARLTELVAAVLKNLGTIHACVVHGRDGMDEVTTCAATTVAELKEGEIRRYEVTPEELGLRRAKVEELQVRDAQESAEVIRGVLGGKRGAAREIVLANAGLGLVAGDVAGDAREGVKRAAEVIDSGAARRALEKLVEVSNRAV